ncbi:hypothetical protein HORIV_39150 [Vreelandella olivaria]|uniref:Lipoyl synthase n=1 Tax=Vreelandella olivaria TaxID=390919 RepID=A0ABM7GL93_9GAMM|nr:hypothetical protein HORIV_39150 [Halomonas olivaria]
MHPRLPVLRGGYRQPQGWLDQEEPENTAKSVELMGLRYIVLTSVDRDDLDDGGATHYANCIRAIKARTPEVVVEALTPDFDGELAAIERVVDSGLQVFAQNVETVERLTSRVRDRRAGYRKTLDVLAHAKRYRPDIITKTSLMLGLGETDEEILQTFDDLREIGVDIVTLGQYLRPTKNHLSVERWVTPEEFDRYRVIGLEKALWKCLQARWYALATAPTGCSRKTTWGSPPCCDPRPGAGSKPQYNPSAQRRVGLNLAPSGNSQDGASSPDVEYSPPFRLPV